MMNLYNIRNSNTHSQTGVWERGLRPVGRVALIPTFVYITNKFYCSMEILYANVFCLYGLFLCACFCRDEGIPTYGYYLMPNLFNSAFVPKGIYFNKKSTLRKSRC